MKSKLKQNNGFALTAVIFILFLLTVFGTSMYAYTMSSLKSVRFLSDRKKAEYLAQAGVEAASYAYQLAVDAQGDDTVIKDFLVGTNNEDKEIKTNDIYLIWDRGSTPKQYRYVTQADLGLYDDKDIIGYYNVTIKSLTETRTATFLKNETLSDGSGVITGGEVELIDRQRRFIAHGFAYGSGASDTKSAVMSEPTQALGMFYDKDGANAGVVDGVGNSNFTQIGTVKFNQNLTLTTKHFGSFAINVGQRSTPIQMAYSAGNLILNEPTNGKITFKQNQDNIVSFIGINNLFVNSSIDVTPSKKNYNIMFLKGNNIVINGDVEIYVYGFYRNTVTNFASNIGTMADALAGKYRFSTVVLGTPNPDTATEADPVKTSIYNLGRCGKVYFGGDVFVNIEMPNVGVYRYKAFSAGDAYYFDDEVPQNTTSENPYGVDLLKYFLDSAILSGKYSQNVVNRFEDLIQVYYQSPGSAEATKYVEPDSGGGIKKDTMRKIDNKKWVGLDTFSALIPPDPSDASSLMWE